MDRHFYKIQSGIRGLVFQDFGLKLEPILREHLSFLSLYILGRDEAITEEHVRGSLQRIQEGLYSILCLCVCLCI